jgi:hypothetical protein
VDFLLIEQVLAAIPHRSGRLSREGPAGPETCVISLSQYVDEGPAEGSSK